MPCVAVGAPLSTLQAHIIEVIRSVHKRTTEFTHPAFSFRPFLVPSYCLLTMSTHCPSPLCRSVLTNPTNSPFSAGPIDGAEKGFASNGNNRGAYGREPGLAPTTGTTATTTTATGPTATRGLATDAPARTTAAI